MVGSRGVVCVVIGDDVSRGGGTNNVVVTRSEVCVPVVSRSTCTPDTDTNDQHTTRHTYQPTCGIHGEMARDDQPVGGGCCQGVVDPLVALEAAVFKGGGRPLPAVEVGLGGLF